MNTRRTIKTDEERLAAIRAVLDDEARDMHGVFYHPQRLAQRVAVILGRPAPDDDTEDATTWATE